MSSEQIPFEENELIEIDYTRFGFVLQTLTKQCEWTARPLDEDEESAIIYAPDKGYTLDTPISFMGVEFTREKLEAFESLRKDAEQTPLPSLL